MCSQTAAAAFSHNATHKEKMDVFRLTATLSSRRLTPTAPD